MHVIGVEIKRGIQNYMKIKWIPRYLIKIGVFKIG
jgi:hypothetical protein